MLMLGGRWGEYIALILEDKREIRLYPGLTRRGAPRLGIEAPRTIQIERRKGGPGRPKAKGVSRE